ncbi:hypothetical protein GLOIN_2v1584141 [Rhizophagus irregularis DAOM 181602=DAOM 197198]|uniref:Uncharacterized protein n=1 Tax=Rhizophagus irregularis (strain DAOM 181602 / DAOM 197198 / MUCL 43194) TaxID=747089 RepID=A0A2P4Q7M7_RHIID|nr:hypothetical protein GLOIN_2v1584141 [Rhizophagus irregularis DAOM 181602=DAOM 197198]POG73645.1 hypothetical protein GLOIN_2v1584141 [Rhizophagus irregularis DAOM 181602=DAOM 197198]|eukprot:XP_025180511.1 hypothetical protein GLOIN_2v1584141 [Rhizophagus irregularis DAOM 181602=DAOM 197198]
MDIFSILPQSVDYFGPDNLQTHYVESVFQFVKCSYRIFQLLTFQYHLAKTKLQGIEDPEKKLYPNSFPNTSSLRYNYQNHYLAPMIVASLNL